jgi:hypothetical protein
MDKKKEMGYEICNIAFNNLEGFDVLWTKADFDTKEFIVNESGKKVISLYEEFIGDNKFKISDEKFRELFNELINAGRDMQIRDNLGNSYISEDMYYKDIKKRYLNED